MMTNKNCYDWKEQNVNGTDWYEADETGIDSINWVMHIKVGD